MKIKYSTIVLSFAALTFFSCTSIKDTVYLQDVFVDGPLNPPPVRITKDKSAGTVTLSPRLTFNNVSDVIGNIGSRRYLNSVQDSLFPYGKKNLLWKIPKYTFGLDFDVAVTSNFAIAGGLNFSTVNQNSLIGGSLGLALFQEKDGIAVRFDAGLLIQELYYEAKTVVVSTYDPIWGSPTTEEFYYNDIDKNSGLDLYAALTINSAMNDFPFNFFLNFSYFSQTILDFNPGTRTDLRYLIILTEKTIEDARGEASSSFLSASPGIFLDLTEWSRLVLGARILYDIGLDSSSKDLFILPVIQFDMHF